MCILWLIYIVSIFPRQVAGRLHVELGRLSGNFPQDRQGDADSESSGEGSNRNSMIESMMDDDEYLVPGAQPLPQDAIVSRVSQKFMDTFCPISPLLKFLFESGNIEMPRFVDNKSRLLDADLKIVYLRNLTTQSLTQMLFSIVQDFVVCVQVYIKSAKGLPRSLSHFVYCQYNFWGHSELIVVPPCVENTRYAQHPDSGGASFVFEDKQVGLGYTSFFSSYILDC